LVDSTNKLDDDTSELETTITYLAKKMKDEGDGDNDIWMKKKKLKCIQTIDQK